MACIIKLTKKWILSHCDLGLWPKVTNFNRVWASVLSDRLAKTASKSVYLFVWNFVHEKWAGHTDRQTDTQTNCSENITPPQFYWGVKMKFVCSIEFEIWTFVWRKLKWHHNDVIPHLIFMKILYKSATGISKRHITFQIDQTYESWNIQ